jgi:hypothetical protein
MHCFNFATLSKDLLTVVIFDMDSCNETWTNRMALFTLCLVLNQISAV